ncbi:ABC transporter substrate-binding protein [Rhodococcus koreensis]|uniref:ABC transporter substrate-binding protein n=1 Tax=Rhodococcus koreensis TaxID=99653 RepID=UPI00366C6F23
MPGRQFNRRTVLRAGALTAGLLVASCGTHRQQAPPGQIGGNLSFSYWGNQSRAAKAGAVIDLFEAAHPGATVEGQSSDYVAYIERLPVRAAGRDLAGVTTMQSTFFAPYATQGALLPLDDLIAQGVIDVSNIPADVLQSGRIDGRQYMIPTGSYLRPIAYNADLLSSIGITPPATPWTWDEYIAWLYAIQPRLPAGVYASEAEGATLFSLFSWVAGHGEQFFADDGLAFPPRLLAEFFQLWHDLAAEGISVPPSMVGDQIGALERTPIARGVAAVGTRDIPHLTITEKALSGAGLPSMIGWLTCPVAGPGMSGNVIGSNGLVISADSDNVQTAAEFVNFFANDPGAIRAFQSDNGVVPGPRSQDTLLSDPATPAGVRRSITVLRELVDAGDVASTTYPKGITTLTNDLRRLYEDVTFGRTDISEAVDDFFGAARRALS